MTNRTEHRSSDGNAEKTSIKIFKIKNKDSETKLDASMLVNEIGAEPLK